MLKKIQIKNFQSHADTTIELSGNITVIHGSSDSGKSAVIRAINSVIQRHPFYIRNGEKKGEVVLEFDDCVIAREFIKTNITKCPSCKNKIDAGDDVCSGCGDIIPAKPSSDRYIVDGETYDKFGTNLPPMITEKSRLFPYKFGEFEVFVNVSNQFDDMFFIGNTYNGSIRNKMISGLIPDAERVDETIRDMTSEKSDFNSQLKYMRRELEETENKFDLINGDVDDLQKLYTVIEKLEKSISEMSQEVDALKGIKKFLDQNAMWGRIGKAVNGMSEKLELGDKFADNISSIEDQVKELHTIKNTIGSLKLLDQDMLEYVNKTAMEEFEELTKEYIALSSMSRDINMLTLLRINIPKLNIKALRDFEMEYENSNSEMEKIKILKEHHAIIAAEMEKIVLDTAELEEAKQILETEFRNNNKNLICPVINDIYSDECLSKIKIDK